MFFNGGSCAAVAAAAAGMVQVASAVYTAAEAMAAMNPGWNLGNTLDAIPDETSWGNPAVTAETFQQLAAQGFKSVRLPITWDGHLTSAAPNYTIDTAWLDRVSQVIDWALESFSGGVVINVHHDSWEWADFTNSGTLDDLTLDERFEKYQLVWTQIAEAYKDKDERLIFEALNEPAGSASEENADEYNKSNQIFVNVVRASGSNNTDRLLSISGLNMNIANTVSWFTVPDNATNWLLQVHDYDPWDFVSTSYGKTWWGSDDDKSAIEDTFISLQDTFNTPALIGEWGTTEASVERGASWVYWDYLVRTAASYNLTTQIWDNGEHFNRATGEWNDPVKPQIIMNAVAGIPNSLPAYEQLATLYYPVGTAISSAQPINITFNGNTIKSVTNSAATTLTADSDYTVTSDGITLSSSYLSTIDTTSTGVKDTVTIAFSQGVSLPFDIAVYQTPTITSSTDISLSDANSDLSITLDGWQGTSLATIKGIGIDGTYVKDTWTEYLGDLQQARLSWGDFGVSGDQVVVYAATLAYIQTLAEEVELTLEFWPRIPGNNATVSVTVA